MPIYAFACPHCGHTFDRLQKLSDPDPTACPACQQPGVTRQVTAPHVRLTGKGWYETDFKPADQQRHVARSDAAPAVVTPAPSPSGTAS
jgi:putative FmdB family regulatory protein